MRIVGPESEFADGFDAAADRDAEEFKRLDKRIAELKEALVGLVLACDVDDVYEDDNSDRPAMVAARAAIRKQD